MVNIKLSKFKLKFFENPVITGFFFCGNKGKIGSGDKWGKVVS
jgi:hypothetical protein